MQQQDLAVACGYWPLFRYNPAMRATGENPFRLDSPRPTIPFRDYAYNEIRYKALAQFRPQEAAELLTMAQSWWTKNTASTRKWPAGRQAAFRRCAPRQG